MRGLSSFTPSEGLELFGRLTRDRGAAHVGVMPMEWSSWFEANPSAAEASLTSPWNNQEAQAKADANAGLLDEFLALPEDDRLPHLEAFVCQLLSKVLGLSASGIDVTQPIHRMGLDSLMAVELRNRFEREVGLTLSIPKLLQGRTVRQLAQQIAEHFEEETSAAVEVEDLSEDEVDALLLEMMAEAEGLA